MFSCIIVFSVLFGLSMGQFPPTRRVFGRFGGNPYLHNSYHRPPINPVGGQNGGMFGSNGMGGGMGGGMGPQGGVQGLGGNMFGPPNGPPSGRGGICPMLQGVDDMQSFKTSCFTLMQTAPQDAECTPGPWGRQCPSGSQCCPQAAVDGSCQLKCSTPIASPIKVGSCPTGFYDKPDPGLGWISGMCFYAKSKGLAWEPECRFDGDCSGTQKCCSPDLNLENIFGTCIRKCTEIE